ncbi:MAG TPA: response regulator [Polyangiaceae bacterium]|nr:response regulator [Polyangiaceae bacterium]
MILRAEIASDGARTVTHTVDVAETAVTLACDSLAVGAKVRILLSFPAQVDTFTVETVVTSIEAKNGRGRPALTRCRVVSADARARRMLAGLAASSLRASAAVEPDATGPGRGRGYRCLLVEDNRFIRELFAYGMQRYCAERRAELTLELASDAETAWEMLARGRFDMVLIDHFLPHQSGPHLIGRMRAAARFSRMPVVAISVAGPEARAEALGAGADLFLEKPVGLRELFSTLDQLTARCAR